MAGDQPTDVRTERYRMSGTVRHGTLSYMLESRHAEGQLTISHSTSPCVPLLYPQSKSLFAFHPSKRIKNRETEVTVPHPHDSTRSYEMQLKYLIALLLPALAAAKKSINYIVTFQPDTPDSVIQGAMAAVKANV